MAQETADWPAKMRRAGFFEGMALISRGKEIGAFRTGTGQNIDSPGTWSHAWWMFRMVMRLVVLGVLGLVLLTLVF